MFVVLALVFPVVLLLGVLGMGVVERRLERQSLGADVDSYLASPAPDSEDAERVIAARAAELLGDRR